MFFSKHSYFTIFSSIWQVVCWFFSVSIDSSLFVRSTNLHYFYITKFSFLFIVPNIALVCLFHQFSINYSNFVQHLHQNYIFQTLLYHEVYHIFNFFPLLFIYTIARNEQFSTNFNTLNQLTWRRSTKLNKLWF